MVFNNYNNSYLNKYLDINIYNIYLLINVARNKIIMVVVVKYQMK